MEIHELLLKDPEDWKDEDAGGLVKAVCEMVVIAMHHMEPKMLIEEWRQHHPDITDDDANALLESQIIQVLGDERLIGLINGANLDEWGNLSVDEQLLEDLRQEYKKTPALEEA